MVSQEKTTRDMVEEKGRLIIEKALAEVRSGKP